MIMILMMIDKDEDRNDGIMNKYENNCKLTYESS